MGGDAELKVLRDFAEAKGRFWKIHHISGRRGSDNLQHYIKCDAVVLVTDSSRDDVIHYTDEWIDPTWDVIVISGMPSPPLHSCWIYGRSYNTVTGEEEEGDVCGDVDERLTMLCNLKIKLGQIPDQAPPEVKPPEPPKVSDVFTTGDSEPDWAGYY